LRGLMGFGNPRLARARNRECLPPLPLLLPLLLILHRSVSHVLERCKSAHLPLQAQVVPKDPFPHHRRSVRGQRESNLYRPDSQHPGSDLLAHQTDHHTAASGTRPRVVYPILQDGNPIALCIHISTKSLSIVRSTHPGGIGALRPGIRRLG
jgi:hypothetical protein